MYPLCTRNSYDSLKKVVLSFCVDSTNVTTINEERKKKYSVDTYPFAVDTEHLYYKILRPTDRHFLDTTKTRTSQVKS
jgi:hypothetical protein